MINRGMMMTSFKTVLLAATALTLMSGAAFAQSNSSFTDQRGADNILSIDQTAASGSAVGTASNPALQNGDNNNLIVNQSGSGQQIGAAGGDFLQRGSGVNLAQFDQDGSNNNVLNVLQISGTTDSPGVRDNFLNVFQAGNGNIIRSVTQRNQLESTDTTSTNNSELVQRVGGNEMTEVIQIGNRNFNRLEQAVGSGNFITLARQVNTDGGDGNSLRILQSGSGNVVGSANQQNTGGAINTASLTFTGNNNGNLGIFSEFSIDGFQGGDVGSGNSVRQVGFDNLLTADFTGAGNRFGFTQVGSLHTLDVDVLGDDNEIAVYQQDSNNDASIDVTGTSNDIGVSQFGTTNTATITVSSNGNTAVANQNGNQNQTTVLQ